MRQQHAQLPAWGDFAHRAEMLLKRNTQTKQQFSGTGFCGVAVHFGEFTFEFADLHAVFFAHFRQRVDAVALGLDLPQVLMAHDHGVDHVEFFVGELILAQLAQAHVRLEHHLTRRGLQIATENLHEGRLAAAIGADQTVAVATGKFDGNVFEQRLGTELHGDVGGRNQRLVLRV